MSTGSDAWTRIARAHSLTVARLGVCDDLVVVSASVTFVLIDFP